MSARRAIFASMLLAVASSIVRADPPPVEFHAFGPTIFQRVPGPSVESLYTFSVPNPAAPYRIRIRNGGIVGPSYPSVFSADILLNGAPVVTFAEFNKKLQLAEKPVTLAATNTLSITLHGRPQSLIEIDILGQDTDLPVITAEALPARNAAGWNNSDVIVEFTCSDGTSEIVSCSDLEVVSTDGIGIVVSGTAVDAAGRTASTSVTLNVDRTPPQISIGVPSDGSLSHASTVTIEGSTDDANGVAGVTCSGVPAIRIGDAFTCETALVVGPNTLYAEAYDLAGNPAIASVSVTRDDDFTAPALTITSPTPLELFATTVVTVTGTVDDPEAIVDVNGRPATLTPDAGGASFEAANVPLKEGSNLIVATAKDAVDNATSVTLQVVRDTTAPVLTIETPADGSTTNESSVIVTGMINEMVVGTFNNVQGTVTINGVPASVENRSFAATAIPLTLGPNTITAIGSDRAGNSVTVTSTVNRVATNGRRIETLSGNGQQGLVSSPLPDPLAVVVKDETGSPVAGATVIFRVVDNNGTLAAGVNSGKRVLAVPTDGSGRAEAAWTLGSRAGAANNRVEAYSVGYQGTSVFTAGAASGTPSEILIDAGNAQAGATGQMLPRPLVVVVADAGHNRIEGVSVTFTVTSGRASFDGQPSVTVVTDTDGRAAAIPTLGPLEGISATRVTATFAGNPGPPVTFIASSLTAGDAAETSISGVVLDNANVPVPGATVKVQGTVLQTITSPEGQFSITGAPVGNILLDIDGSTTTRAGTWPMLEFDLATVAGRDNTVGMPIYLLPLDIANGVFVDETHGGTVTLGDIPGFALDVAPGSATFLDGSTSGRVHVTAVHTDKVPMLPSFGSQPRLTVTIQPMGVHFDPPARLTVPNFDGLAPGTVTDMYSFDHDLGQFVGIGTGTVSEDGTVIRSDPGVGVVKGGWHWAGPPTPDGDLDPCSEDARAGLERSKDSCCQRTECQVCIGGTPTDIELGPVEIKFYADPDLVNPVTAADTTQTIEAHADLNLGECGAPHYEWNIVSAEVIDQQDEKIRVKFHEWGNKTFNVTVTCGSCLTVGQDGAETLFVNEVTLDARFRFVDPGRNELPLVETTDPNQKDKALRTLGGMRIHLDPPDPQITPAHPIQTVTWSADAGHFYDGEYETAPLSPSQLENKPPDFAPFWEGEWTVGTTSIISAELTLADNSKLHGKRPILTRTLLDGHEGDDVKMLQTALHLFGHSSEIRNGNFGVEGNDVPQNGKIEPPTAAAIGLFQFAADILKYPRAKKGQPPPPPPPIPPALVDGTTLTQISRQWEHDVEALGAALASSTPSYFQRADIPADWIQETADILQQPHRYTLQIHNAVSGNKPYNDLITAWIAQESTYGHWGFGSKPYRMTMGTADPEGSIGFSQVTRRNKYGSSSPLPAGANLYDPHDNVLAFAQFACATGQGFEQAFGSFAYNKTWSRYPWPSLSSPGTTLTTYADDNKDRLSKALRAYNAGAAALDFPWPILLMLNESPAAGTTRNGARYSLEIQNAAQIPLRNWVWRDQAIVADANGRCYTTVLGSGAEGDKDCQDKRPPNWTSTASTPFRVCIVATAGCMLKTQHDPHESVREFQFEYSEDDWLPPDHASTGINFEDRRDGCIPIAIPNSPAVCP